MTVCPTGSKGRVWVCNEIYETLIGHNMASDAKRTGYLHVLCTAAVVVWMQQAVAVELALARPGPAQIRQDSIIKGADPFHES